MVKYDIDDTFCPHGHKWIRVKSSLLFGDYYYCEQCDKIYTPTVEVKTKGWFKREYLSERREELIKLAHTEEARKRVTNADLKKLGYL